MNYDSNGLYGLCLKLYIIFYNFHMYVMSEYFTLNVLTM